MEKTAVSVNIIRNIVYLIWNYLYALTNFIYFMVK